MKSFIIKNKKSFIIALLSIVVLSFCFCFIQSVPQQVKADTKYSVWEMTNDNKIYFDNLIDTTMKNDPQEKETELTDYDNSGLSFTAGISMKPVFNETSFAVRFQLNKKFSKYDSKYGRRFYYFMLYTVDGNQSYTPIEVIGVQCDNKYYTYDFFGICNGKYNGVNIGHYSYIGYEYMTIDKTCFNESGLIDSVDIVLPVTDPYVEYRLAVKYIDRLYTGKNWTGACNQYSEFNCVTLYSSQRSVAGFLEKYRADEKSGYNDLSEEDKQYVDNIVDNIIEENITVQYLKEIPNTPFAYPVTEKITVTKKGGENAVSNLSVLSALSVADVTVFGSHLTENGFVYDENTKKYKANYYVSICFTAKTVDGNEKSYFLDINQSYAEMFYGMIGGSNKASIMTKDVYDFFYNSMVLEQYKKEFVEFTETTGIEITESGLYGYFGYIVIPQTLTLNSVLSFFFDTQTGYKGVIKEYHSNGSLTNAAYLRLLEEYGYTQIERSWQSIINKFESLGSDTVLGDATHYMLYADPYCFYAEIDESGDDNLKVGDILKTILAIVLGILLLIVLLKLNILTYIVKGIIWLIKAPFKFIAWLVKIFKDDSKEKNKRKKK